MASGDERSGQETTQSKAHVAAAAATESRVFTSPEIAKSFDFTSEESIYNCGHLEKLEILVFIRGKIGQAPVKKIPRNGKTVTIFTLIKKLTCYILAIWLSGVESSGELNMETEGEAITYQSILPPIPPLASWSSSNVNATSSAVQLLVFIVSPKDWKDDKSRMKVALILVSLVEGVLLLFAFHAYDHRVNLINMFSSCKGDDIERAAAEFLDPKTISKNFCRYAGVVTVEGITDVLENAANFLMK
ncbi:hypothetical protein Syun_025416 [Stephania yunnanensis]|uniref:Uncharacterized protein n=1 Tax=Stephania yunnanensis TaxID=152371 RepID=A0AAP0HVS4_9MAGN